MNLQALLYFYETAQHASINKAASVCFVSASSLSRALSGLEKELETTLFERSYAGIELTRAGKELLEKLKPHIEQLKQVMEGYSGGGLNRSTLRLLICAYQSIIVSQALVNFYQRCGDAYEYADIILDAYLTADQVLEHMEAADYTLGMIHFAESEAAAYRETLQKRGYELLDMPSLHGCVTVRSGHPLAALSEVTQEQLAPFPRVAYIGEDPWELMYCSDFHNFKPTEVRKRILVKERGFLHDILRNTDAYFVGVDSRRFEILGGALTSIPVAGMTSNIQTLLFYRQGRGAAPAVRGFIDEVQAVFDRFAG